MLNPNSSVAAVAALLLCTTGHELLGATFVPGDYVTYSQESWGALSSDAADLLLNSFVSVYPNGVETGVPGAGGHSMLLTTWDAVLDYLPTSGNPQPLENDLLDPPSSPAGAFGGYVLALQLNVDLAEAGLLLGSSATPFDELILMNMESAFGDMSALNGVTVRQYLGLVNTRLGGGAALYSDEQLAFLTNELGRAFEGGTVSQFAEDHLQLSAPIPEPGTLGLLCLGLAGFTAKRFKQKRC